MSQLRSFKSIPHHIVFMIAMLFFIVETALSFLIFEGQFYTYLIGHYIFCLASLFLLIFLHKWRYDLKLAALFLINVSFLGFFGALGNVLLLTFYPFFRSKARPFMEWYDELFPDHDVVPIKRLYEDLKTGRYNPLTAPKVASFYDLMQHGKPAEKQAVIQIIVRHFEPRFSQLLMMALKDDDPFVRVQAATAVSHLEHQFQEQAHDIKELLDDEPDHFDHLFAYACLFDDYSYTGILGEERESENREHSKKYLKLCLEKEPNNLNVIHRYVRLLFREKLFSEARIIIEPLIDDGLEDHKLLAWYIECLYELKLYEKLHAFLVVHHKRLENLEQENVRIIIEHWQKQQEVLGHV